ncbi:MAG: N-acetyltransferase [Betaproteobacteria bacterium]|nr:N-acetyltransferase [Betaproteobacteria bacterium]
MLIRPAEYRDHARVHALNLAVFDSPVEANLVDALRELARPIVELVAEDNDEIAGHLLLSPVSLPGRPELSLMGLGPMAVVPARRRNGIGSALVESGLDCCRRLGVVAVVVLGHPEYYPRFGFSPASRFGISTQYEVPDEVFMLIELQPYALKGITGMAKYHPAFSAV